MVAASYRQGTVSRKPSNVVVTDATGRVALASAATYVASGSGYTAYTSPTDTLVLKGSASKIVRVQQVLFLIQSTSATLLTPSIIRRTAANTGGTASQPTIIAVDTSDSAATAVVDLYSAAPSALGAGSTLLTLSTTTSATTASAAVFQLATAYPATNAFTLAKPITLRGVAQSIAFNFGGASLPAGFTANWQVVWTESDA